MENVDYNRNSFLWLGAEYSKGSDRLEWTDGSKMSFTGWVVEDTKPSRHEEHPLCLGLQSKMSSLLPMNLYWSRQRCSYVGGYVCKTSRINNVPVRNQTITGVEGRLMSPNYPNKYAPNVNYWIKLIAPEKSRIVLQFQKLDIEPQNECLYDYVSVQDANLLNNLHTKALVKNLFKSGEAISMDYHNDEDDLNYKDEKIPLLISEQSKRDLKVFSFNNNSAPSFQTYVRMCGSHENDMTKFDFVSKSNEILLNFFSDYSITGSGFSALWRSIDISACPGMTFTSREGVLSSPNFPHFMLHNLNCTYIIQAPVDRKVWIEFNSFDIFSDAEVYIDLGDDVLLQPFKDTSNIGDGAFLSQNERLKIIMITGSNPMGKGFNVTYKTSKYSLVKHLTHFVSTLKHLTVLQVAENRILKLSNATFGSLYHLNYPQAMPAFIDYTQHLSVDFGSVISVELHGVQFDKKGCEDSTSIEVRDYFVVEVFLLKFKLKNFS